jgi:hypothetical protein
MLLIFFSKSSFGIKCFIFKLIDQPFDECVFAFVLSDEKGTKNEKSVWRCEIEKNLKTELSSNLNEFMISNSKDKYISPLKRLNK